MKLIILSLVTVLSVQTWAAEAATVILANRGDFGVVSDVTSPELKVFLSGTGPHYGKCGIALRSIKLSAVALQSVLDISGQTKGSFLSEDGRLVAEVVRPEINTFGANFFIKTKSGANIEAVLSQLNEHEKADVIVEPLYCP